MDLQTLLDIEEIKQLRYSFAWCLENAKPDELADLFTNDGIVDVGVWGRMEGQDAIRRGYGRAYAKAETFPSMHAVTNPRIRVDGDRATGTWYLLNCVFGEADTNPLKMVGIYDEDYRREQKGWLISRLHLKFLWSEQFGRITPENPMRMLGLKEMTAKPVR